MSKFAAVQSVELTDQTTLDCTMKVLEESFELSADGYVCKTRDLYQILVTAAVRQGTIEAACQDLRTAPDSNTVREYLAAQLTGDRIGQLEKECNRALAACWPQWLWSRSLEIAADLHDACYYGDYDSSDPQQWVHKAQKRNGTNLFYRCATLFTIRNALRITLAVVFVHPSDELLGILERLLSYVRAAGLHIDCLYADKEFCSIAILRYLGSQKSLSAIIPVPLRGEKDGTKARCQGRHSFFDSYTFHNDKDEVTVKLAYVRAYKKHRHEPRKATWLVYALIRINDSLPHIRQRYRYRFGIDTSYRLVEQVRARTTSTNPALRFFLMGLALILVNVWVRLKWTYLRISGSGPRRVASAAFTLLRMTHFIIHVIETAYQPVSTVELRT